MSAKEQSVSYRRARRFAGGDPSPVPVVLAQLVWVVFLALAGLRVASWEPALPFDFVLVALAWVLLGFVGLWLLCVAWMLLRYDVWGWLSRRLW